MTAEERSVYMKEYRKKNKERIKQQKREWKERNPEKIKEYNKRYCEKNRERLAQKAREWREAKSDTNSQLIEQLADKVEKIADLEKENAELNGKNKELGDRLCNIANNLLDNWCRNEEDYCPHLAKLEKENAKLETDYEVLSCSVGDFGELQEKLEEEQRKNNGLSDNLTKAKDLLNEFMRISKASDEDFEHDYSELIAEAEQFLKEIGK